MKKGFTLRLTGGLAVDIFQIFIKGHGVYSSVGSKSHPVKKRGMYEVAGLGYLVEKAGGKTIS